MKKLLDNIIVVLIVLFVGASIYNKQLKPLEKIACLPWSLI